MSEKLLNDSYRSDFRTYLKLLKVSRHEKRYRFGEPYLPLVLVNFLYFF
ncbi:MAG: hypothetical protein AB8G15_13505 [Saprospiraceae bacterium]